MAINVDFYTFSKVDNSTKQPTGTGTTYSCTLKEPCSAINPVIALNLGSGNPTAFNYAHISDFGRWYYVTDWTYDSGLWYAALKVDVLATYKTQIGSSTLYVLRSASDYDGSINDLMYPVKFSYQTVGYLPGGGEGTFWWWNTSNTISDGYFIVGILSNIGSNATAGGITYAAFTPAQFKAFCSALFSDTLAYYDPGSLDISQTLAKMVFQPFDYITSVIWLPDIPIASQSNTRTGLWISFFELDDISWTEINPGDYLIYVANFEHVEHPDAATRGSYLNTLPYTRMLMTLPRLGTVPIDTSFIDFSDTNLSLQVLLRVDPITGAGIYTLSGSLGGPEMARYNVQIGVNVQLANTGFTGAGAANALTAAGNLISDVTRTAEGSITGGISAIGDIMELFQPHAETTASQGGYLELANTLFYPKLVCTYFDVADDDNTHAGRPLCQDKQISLLSGYIIVRDGDVEIPGTYGEAAAVKAYLEGGFYYE